MQYLLLQLLPCSMFTNDWTSNSWIHPSSGKLFWNCLKIIRVFTVSVQVRFGLGIIGFVKQFYNSELYHYNLLWKRRSTWSSIHILFIGFSLYTERWKNIYKPTQRCCTAVAQCSLQFTNPIWANLVCMNPFKHFHL